MGSRRRFPGTARLKQDQVDLDSAGLSDVAQWNQVWAMCSAHRDMAFHIAAEAMFEALAKRR